MKKTNKVFLIIILGIILISCLSLFLIFTQKTTGMLAEVSVYGEVLHTFDLDTLTEPLEFRIDNKKGGLNTIRVEKGRIGIIYANCPDQLCVKRGFISNSLFPNVCLPNGLAIEIVSDHPSTQGIDTLAE